MAVAVSTAQSTAMDGSVLVVECEITSGFAGIQLIGNVAEVCRNGVERAKSSLGQLGIRLPQRRVLLSIAPADLRKDGSQFDLAFAVSLGLVATQEPQTIDPRRWMFVAELSLAGELRPVKAVVSYALSAIAGGLAGMVVSRKNIQDISALSKFKIPNAADFQILGFEQLGEVLAWVKTGGVSPTPPHQELSSPWYSREDGPNFDDMNLTDDMATVAMVACIGRHNLLLYGAPGTGKSMFAARLASIMPPMHAQEHMEALKITSSCHERIPKGVLAGRPPFRAPHHQTSPGAILGTPFSPGELSLAHGGLLFLDEFSEFRRDIIEALREPLESGEIHISRAKEKVCWLAKVSLIAATNNCPCGWFGSSFKRCFCSHNQIIAYRRKISGPILDRIDIHFNTPDRHSLKSRIFAQDNPSGNGQTNFLATQVLAAQEHSLARNQTWGRQFNNELGAQDLALASGLSPSDFHELIEAYVPGDLSHRGLIRSLRVARSLADLARREEICPSDLKKALGWQAQAAAMQRGDDCHGL